MPEFFIGPFVFNKIDSRGMYRCRVEGIFITILGGPDASRYIVWLDDSDQNDLMTRADLEILVCGRAW